AAGLDHEHGIYDTDRLGADGPGQNDWSTEQVNDYEGWPNTMEESLGGGSVIGDLGFLKRQYMVNEDDREGLRKLYPSSSNDGLDVAVQSYHTPDADTIASAGPRTCWTKIGERSRPDPYTDFLGQAVAQGLPFGTCPEEMKSPFPDSPFPIFQGAYLDATFSLLNLGNLDTEVDWEILISPSDIDFSRARVLLRRTSTLNVNRPFEVTSTVQIPLDMRAGGYWIVARMDPDGQLSEWDEGNNVAIWNRYVEVVPLSACGCSTGPGAPGLVLAGLSGLILRRRRRA
ncbi:MAG TPA: MYXO-CTERM sorting domain-containing protein, partial [Myxococcota bacterium]|nr:MYXO-CTERM sorting domain-containing protein [Myxococcota bacterium]